uniref:Anti-silencing factor n=1 Tax=Globodera rostochiensis TaxID=31243 RepID=A0A914GYQ3_GLORO
MCSRINVVCVQLLENPANPSDPIKLEITFEIFENIKEDVEWELVFVGTDGREEHDQVLDSVLIGPIQEGRHKFVFEAPPPQIQNLRPEDFMDVTLLLLKCKYREQLFMKIGWFVTHTYTDPELIENPPSQPAIEKLKRTIVSEDVRVTSYPIKWDEEQQSETSTEVEPNAEMSYGVASIELASNSNSQQTMSQQDQQQTPMAAVN